MNDQEIDNTIALACGWTKIHCYEDNSGPPIWSGIPFVSAEDRFKISADTLNDMLRYGRPIPSYTTDLNAMHLAWLTLDRAGRIAFSRALRIVVVYVGMSALHDDIVALCENATAHQRAEAFLRRGT